MEQNETIKILLVDDHPFVLEGIRSSFMSRPGFQVVGEAGNGREAIDKARELCPDVIIMDITMPLMNGLDATRHLRKILPEAKVLILTMHEKKEFTDQIIASGAHGYVSKNTSPLQLVQAVETIHRGDTFFSPQLKDAFFKEYLQNGGSTKPPQPQLSLREREVLTLIAEGLSNKEAASVLGVSVRTVEKHRERIMDKLELHSVVELTKYAIAHQIVQVS